MNTRADRVKFVLCSEGSLSVNMFPKKIVASWVIGRRGPAGEARVEVLIPTSPFAKWQARGQVVRASIGQVCRRFWAKWRAGQ